MARNSDQLVRLDAGNPVEGSLSSLFGLNREELGHRMEMLGQPAWRARQIADALYRQWATELSEITPLSKSLRARLIAEGWKVGRPRVAQVFRSSDGTERYLVECLREDGGPGSAETAETVETVWMPQGDDGEAGDEADGDGADESLPGTEKRWDRATICVSSQVGCAVNCQFCLTAKLGLQRNLTAGEIAGQVVAVFARQGVDVGRDRVNLVFMGMGEPFLNFGPFMKAVRLLVEEVGLSPRRMTVSTSGIVPGIERFALEPPEVRPKLAISLNAPNDAIRGEVMPVNRKWPIDAVIEAVRRVPLRPRERVTFEYVLLGGVTDRPQHARDLARLARRSGLPAKVNLIAWNPGPGIAYQTPAPEAVEAFRCALIDAGVPAHVRKPRGRDIYAACGQLKRTVEN